jgi:formamidopyrimidine-DNA glycosylase
VPELPEVETVRSGLADLVVGCTVTGVKVFRLSCVRHQPGGEGDFAMRLQGKVLDAVVRRGKYLWIPLAELEDAGRGHTPAMALSAHLGMSGQFRVFEGDPPEPHRHCRARLHLESPDGARTVDFLDQRTFGYLVAEQMQPTPDGLAGGHGSSLPAVPRTVAHIARDALDPAADDVHIVSRMRRGSRGIKQVLLDQTVVSGVGNIYADEALWAARIHPQRPARAVSPPQARDLLAAVRTVMTRALAQGGTSFDALYVNVNGESGYFSRELAAYGRAGQPCERCGGQISLERIGGRSTHWCPRCQRRYGPKASRD